jgi:hypothetical protein
VLAAIALVTGGTLAFQVVLTRLLSAVMPYHFSFLAISLGLLGTGAGALIIYVRPQWFERRPLETTLAHWTILYAVLLVLVPFVLVNLNFAGLERKLSGSFVAVLAAACVAAALPSVAAGVVVALAIRGYTSAIGKVYAWDLVGAGAGALLVVPALYLAAPTLMVVLAFIAGLAAVLFGWAAARERAVGIGVVALAALVVLVSLGSNLLYLEPRYGFPRDQQAADEWNPLARVVGYDLGPNKDALLFYDRVFAPVPRLVDGKLPDWRALLQGGQSIGYELTGPGHTLIIGGGGGRDIANALTSGQRPVDVIELNGGIRDVVDDALGKRSGHPYSRPGVHTTIGDGRSVLASRDTKYDTIHIGFTDTLSANAAQGFALTENNLYTTEAFGEYLDHLKPNGVLNVTRLFKLVGDEALRATVLTLAALEEHGVEDPERNVVVISGKDWFGERYGTILARLEPYTASELAKIRRLAEERADGVVFAPDGPYRYEWKGLHEEGWDSFCHGFRVNVCPPTDDKPYFFNMKRIDQAFQRESGYRYSTDPYDILLLTLVILVVLSAIGFLLPLRLVRQARRPKLVDLLYFAAIGLGFLLLEIVLVQRFVLFLGFPTYALSVVLFSLLVFSGCGSFVSGRLSADRRTLTILLSALVVLIAGTAFALQPLLGGLIGQSLAVRVVVTMAMLAPFGLLLGTAMPIGLRRFAAVAPAGVPYAWGVNGIASVLGSVLGVTIAINNGFAVASLVACGCYVVALLHAWFGRWTSVETLDPPEASHPRPSAPVEPVLLGEGT